MKLSNANLKLGRYSSLQLSLMCPDLSMVSIAFSA